MKLIISVVLALSVGLFLGANFGMPGVGSGAWFSPSGGGDQGNDLENDGEKKPLYWVAPMDKNYRRDGPGLSPMGMDLVPVYEEDIAGGDENSVKISAVVENNLGVKTAKVRQGRLTFPVETVGTVQLDESRIQHIHSRVEGWIERLNVSASGETVRAGQTLFELYSPALVNAQEEFLAAIRSGNRSLIRASKSRLTALGLTNTQVRQIESRRQVEQRVKVLAEQDGIVIRLNVRKGMYIKPALEIMSVGTLDSVWVMAEVFERQAYQVSRAQDAEVQLAAAPGRSWRGMVNYIYPELDARTRTLQARIRVHNPDHALKPNMLTRVSISSTAEHSSVNVPRSAVIKTRHHARVVKSLGDGVYQSVIVELGREGEMDDVPYVEVTSGLSESDKVVSSAHFLIDSESNIEADLARMEVGQADSLNEQKGAKRVESTGVVNSTMEAMGMINLTHAPIPELDWPEMKMNFPTADDVSLEGFKPGDEVNFTLWVDMSAGMDYRIEHITTQDGRLNTGTRHDMDMTDMDSGARHEMEHSMDHESMMQPGGQP